MRLAASSYSLSERDKWHLLSQSLCTFSHVTSRNESRIKCYELSTLIEKYGAIFKDQSEPRYQSSAPMIIMYICCRCRHSRDTERELVRSERHPMTSATHLQQFVSYPEKAVARTKLLINKHEGGITEATETIICTDRWTVLEGKTFSSRANFKHIQSDAITHSRGLNGETHVQVREKEVNDRSIMWCVILSLTWYSIHSTLILLSLSTPW